MGFPSAAAGIGANYSLSLLRSIFTNQTDVKITPTMLAFERRDAEARET